MKGDRKHFETPGFMLLSRNCLLIIVLPFSDNSLKQLDWMMLLTVHQLGFSQNWTCGSVFKDH